MSAANEGGAPEGSDATDTIGVSRGAWAPELRDKVAIVTGAGRRRSVGRAIALELARQGTKVVITGTGRDPNTYPDDEKAIGWRDVKSLAEEIALAGSEALPLVVQLGDPSTAETIVRSTIERFGRIDILVNNASAPKGPDRAPVVELDENVWTQMMNINLHAVFYLSQAVARELIRQDSGGSIVNISSVASKVAAPNYGPYASSKAALNALSHVLAMELAPYGIRVNAICPGALDTARADQDRGTGRWEAKLAAIPLGRLGTGMDVAYFCVYLCSDMGSWITGQTINVDGGRIWS